MHILGGSVIIKLTNQVTAKEEHTMNEIQAKLEALKDAKYKLLLIVGTPGTGKSKLIHDYSQETGIPIVDFNRIFGEEVPDGQDGQYIEKFMEDFLKNYKQDVLLFDNKRILYSKHSTIDLLAFLKKISTDKYVIATWNGMIEDNELVHIRSKLPEDLKYPVDTLECELLICK